MPKLKFISHDGDEFEVEAAQGITLKDAAVDNDIPGILAECGGACACATCHVYIDRAWRESVGGPGGMEAEMLEFAFDVNETSRLSCRVEIVDALDGMVIRIPEKQF